MFLSVFSGRGHRPDYIRHTVNDYAAECMKHIKQSGTDLITISRWWPVGQKLFGMTGKQKSPARSAVEIKKIKHAANNDTFAVGGNVQTALIYLYGILTSVSYQT